MNDHRRPADAARGWGTLSVVGVLILAGVLFSANARIAGGVDARQPQDLAQLVEAEVARAAELQLQVDRLQSEVDAFTDAQTGDIPGADPETEEMVAVAAGRRAMTGPGVTVSLWDATPSPALPESTTNDDLVVHQQDLQAVINALWAGRAEAMSLQDQRVIATSAFRCVGNVLRLHGRIYSPPYVVRAIGDPDELLEALEASPEIQTYLQYVERLGLGWSVDVEESIELPAYSGSLHLTYAAIPDGVDPWVSTP